MFTAAERVKIRKHLGYSNVGEAYVFAVGIPTGTQQQFMIEGAMARVMPEGEAEARRLLCILDGIETQGLGDLELLAVDGVGDIKVRNDGQQALDSRYWRYAAELANLLNCPINPYDNRRSGGLGSLNLRVIG